jgi:hypothetical protein
MLLEDWHHLLAVITGILLNIKISELKMWLLLPQDLHRAPLHCIPFLTAHLIRQ